MDAEQKAAITSKRWDSISHQLLRDGAVIGLALQLANGRWCLSDVDGKRLGTASHETVKGVVTQANEVWK